MYRPKYDEDLYYSRTSDTREVEQTYTEDSMIVSSPNERKWDGKFVVLHLVNCLLRTREELQGETGEHSVFRV